MSCFVDTLMEMPYNFRRMNTLGQELKREREVRGISLQDIARTTKININYLIALEEDRLDILPGEFFIKGTIRSYARSIGLDENQAINLYLQAGRPQHPIPYSLKKRHSKDMTPGRWKKLSLYILPLLLLAAVLFLFRPWGKTRPQARQPARSFATAGSQATEARMDSQPASSTNSFALPETAGLHLQLSYKEEVWVRILADGRLLEEGLRQAGEQSTVTAVDRVEMRLGNPGGVSLTINGRRAKPLGTPGMPQTFEITKGNYNMYLAQEP